MDTGTPKVRKRSGLRLAFGLSLALNLVFVGLIAGAAWRFAGQGKGPHAGGPPGGMQIGAPFVRALPREDRRALRQAVFGQASGLPTRAERRAMHEALIAEVRAADFDADAVRELFAQQTAAAQSVLGAAQEEWLRIVGEKSPQERAQLADRLDEMLKRGKSKGKGKHKHEGAKP